MIKSCVLTFIPSSFQTSKLQSFGSSSIWIYSNTLSPIVILAVEPQKMIALIGLLLGFLISALFLIQGKRRSNGDHQDKKKKRSSNEPAEVVKPNRSYSKSEVSEHNKRNDCWIIIKDRVYDVTSYVEEHPGGDAILVHAGDDSTDGFFGPQHATRVFDMIEDFYIGEVSQ